MSTSSKKVRSAPDLLSLSRPCVVMPQSQRAISEIVIEKLDRVLKSLFSDESDVLKRNILCSVSSVLLQPLNLFQRHGKKKESLPRFYWLKVSNAAITILFPLKKIYQNDTKTSKIFVGKKICLNNDGNTSAETICIKREKKDRESYERSLKFQYSLYHKRRVSFIAAPLMLLPVCREDKFEGYRRY